MAYWFARPLDSNNHPRNDKDCVEKRFFNGVRCRMLWSMSEICQQAQGIISCTRHSSVLLIKATNEEWGEEGLRGCCAGDLRTAKGIPACCSAWRNGPLYPHTPAFLHSSGFESLSRFGGKLPPMARTWLLGCVGPGSVTREQCSPSSPRLPACDVARPASACPGDQQRTVRDGITETLAWCEGLSLFVPRSYCWPSSSSYEQDLVLAGWM